MPGFTAEAAFHKRSEGYYQKARDVVASRNGASILPALRIGLQDKRKILTACRQHGGFPWSEGPTNATWGCLFPDGSGIVCSGLTPEQKRTCDTWPA